MTQASDTTRPADPSPRRDEVEQLLAALREGRPGADADLLPLLYDELREQAHRQLRGEFASVRKFFFITQASFKQKSELFAIKRSLKI